MGVVTVIVAVVGSVALVGAVLAPARERVSRGTLVGVTITLLAGLGQLVLAVVQHRPAHAVGLAPLVLAAGVVLFRGARTRGSHGPAAVAETRSPTDR